METPRKFRAQERYSQEIVDFLREHRDNYLTATADGLFYEGSFHQLVRKIIPSAQAGDVVNILRDTGTISQVSHGMWEIRRQNVFFDDETGEPVGANAEQYGHATKAKQTSSDMQQLNKRVTELEDRVTTLTSIIVGWAEGRDDESSVSASFTEQPLQRLPEKDSNTTVNTANNETESEEQTG